MLRNAVIWAVITGVVYIWRHHASKEEKVEVKTISKNVGISALIATIFVGIVYFANNIQGL